MGTALFRHNQEAYESALSLLAKTGKAAVIHPTGTGKSFIGLKLCEDHPDKTVCWISPSEHIFRTQLENWRAAGGEEPGNIRFLTYAKLIQMDRREMAEIRPDLIVLDEFHRCGAAVWGDSLKTFLGMYPNAPVLGLSATNVRYLDNKRDMAEELFDGNIASEMTLGEAVVRGILAAPKYVMAAFVYQKELEKLKSRIAGTRNRAVRNSAEKYYEALRRALEKADGLDLIFRKHMEKPKGKYIVFTANIEAMRECVDHVPEWFGKVDGQPHVYRFYTLDPATLQSFDAFKADNDDTHLRLLFCIDALNEGIHVDDVDGVILFRPTASPTVYKQQIGRALSAGKSGTPVIFDIVNNFEGLYSIGSIEEEMQAAVTYYNHFGEGEQIVAERFRVVDEVRDCRRLFDALEEALTASWDTMYAYAETYYKEHGDLNVPVAYRTPDGCSLGKWVQVQRQVRAGKTAGNLDDERIARLDAVGMRWQSLADLSWERNYAAARSYYEKNGNLDVPTRHIEDGVKLYNWLADLRKTYRGTPGRHGTLTKEQIAALDAIGMRWRSKSELAWEKGYAEAEQYYRTHGATDAALHYVAPDGYKLGVWLSKCREKYAKGTLSKEQIKRLEQIGMAWDRSRKNDWDECFRKVREYYLAHGDLRIPPDYVADGVWLNKWLSEQKQILLGRREGKTLTEEQRQKLASLPSMAEGAGEERWQRRYGELLRYYSVHGNSRLPVGYRDSQGQNLYVWLANQKGYAKSGRMSDRRKKLLMEVGALGT